jgi:RHH-type proline utilization regulon transcriptional repressor/proline dehydrogenase/delta 1-pyrroline-5-carboxylate dehydrogenase
VILTGGTATARAFLELRPELPLFAETGGKNAMIVTEMADHDSAIKHALASAFGHAGQKCSATSLLILEAPLYDDADFQRRLLDAAASLPVGSAWDPVARVTPLIRPPRGDLASALTELDPGEEWLLAPRVHPENPQLWSPGIKLGVKPGSRTHQRELFGPVLAVMRAEDLSDALAIANGTPYGLTAALQSLDPREQAQWLAHMDAGCLYVNRGTTGAIVRRQPFGGRKASCLGPSAKAGGPNYLLQLMHLRDADDPSHVRDYAAAFESHFARPSDPSCLLGQDNYLVYQPLSRMLLRLADGAREDETMRAVLAARVAGTPLAVSALHPEPWHTGLGAEVVFENGAALAARLADVGVRRIRALGAVERVVLVAAQAAGIHVEAAPVVLCGRVELLRYLHEQTRTNDYHRFGNLGERERDERAAIA